MKNFNKIQSGSSTRWEKYNTSEIERPELEELEIICTDFNSVTVYNGNGEIMVST